jgi:hypothetical protein
MISRTGRFKRDYKRISAGSLSTNLDDALDEAVALSLSRHAGDACSGRWILWKAMLG